MQQLSVREVAKMLKVPESVVNGWVGASGLPAERVNGQYRFNRSELLEWATVHKQDLPPEIFHADQGNGHVSLEQALRLGGIVHHVTGTDKESVLRAVVAAMPLPPDYDRDFLLQVFLSREGIGTTDMGNGMAIPHPRYPVVLPVQHAFITLCFLEQPIAFSASAKAPSTEGVHTLFALVSPTVRGHLSLLARLASALRDGAFREVLGRRAAAEEILSEARRLEAHRSAAPQEVS